MSTNTPKLKLYKAKFDNPNSDVVDVLRDVNLNMDILDDNATMSSRPVGVLPPVSETYQGRNIYWSTTGQVQTYDPAHPEIPTDWWEGSGNAQYVVLKHLNAGDLSVPSGSNKTVKFGTAGGDLIPSSVPYGLAVSANRDRITINQVGFYLVGCNVRWAAPGAVTGHEYFTGIRYNNKFGTEVRLWGQGRPTANVTNTCSVSGAFKIGPNDLGSWVEVTVVQSTGAARSLDNFAEMNNFWVVRLGANGTQII